MKNIIDNFSLQAGSYAKHRPTYPPDLYDFLYSLMDSFSSAWDCGTGNGQVAEKLSDKFTSVYASDISEAQLEFAVKKPNITYIKSRAETFTGFDNSFDLITIAQAIHWFDFDSFYSTVHCVAKPNSILAVWGYHNPIISNDIDNIVNEFYSKIMHEYWDPERAMIDERYKTIPFPYPELSAPEFDIVTRFTLAQFLGYLQSWSSVQTYMKKHRTNPVLMIEGALNKLWREDEALAVTFPIFMRVGRVIK